MSILTREERFKDARTVFNKNGNQTMREVEEATGVNKSKIQALEDNENPRAVGYGDIAALAKHYGVSADYLLSLTDDPHHRPAATDELGISATAVKKIHYIQNCAENITDYSAFLSQFLESSLYDFFDALYMMCQANIAEIVYNSTWEDSYNVSDPATLSAAHNKRNNRILEIAASGKYNSVVSSYLQQMVLFDQEQEKLLVNDDFYFGCTFDNSIVNEIVNSRMRRSFDALIRDLCAKTARTIEKQLSEEANGNC